MDKNDFRIWCGTIFIGFETDTRMWAPVTEQFFSNNSEVMSVESSDHSKTNP